MNFRSIRSIRGSANNGFEELCCQLAEAEPAPSGSRFVRNGTPDGGVESYLIEPDGRELGWQAKYFFQLEQAQWQQLDKSVETALQTHPRLRRYIVCLPIDLPDARVEKQKSLRQKWDDRVESWEKLASGYGMSVSFELWGEHQILARLSVESHAGRRWFWFNETELSPAWFARHLSEAIAGAGPRYNSEFNVALPIARRFEALGYTKAFREGFWATRDKVREESGHALGCLDRIIVAESAAAKEVFIRSERSLSQAHERFRDEPPGGADYAELERSLSEAENAAAVLIRLLKHAADESQHLEEAGDRHRATRPFEHELDTLRRYRSAVDSMREFLKPSSGELVSRPAMLLAGEAGSGKTHLLCDIAKHRIEAGLPTLVLLGQQFGGGDVWRQILEQLGLRCTREELLGALESAAQVAGGRALIFVDAINEASECDWFNVLPPFVEVLSRQPRIGVAISCRSTYVRSLVREDLVPGRLSRVEHRGFAPRLFEAIAAFCRHYGIETLNTPPLDPEFENPLFLKLFCKGLHDRGMRRPPKGRQGLQHIFSFLIDSANSKLHRPSELDYPETDRVVQRAVDAIADAMVDAGGHFVPRPRAQAILDSIHPGSGRGYSKSLLRRLVAEGILADDLRFGRGRDEPEPVVRFAYERFADFQIARRLLERHLPAADPAAAFREGEFFWNLFDETNDSLRLSGLLAALIVLVPEKLGRELAELMPGIAERFDYREAFLEALVWREGGDVTDHAIRYVERLLDDEGGGSAPYPAVDDVLDRLVQSAGLPEHPLNARWLHARLLEFSMPERDHHWSTYLHRSWTGDDPESPSVIERLLEWAWPGDPDRACSIAGCDDEVVELAATAVAWCLTASNRFIRDRATKALACLLGSRPDVIPGILEAFCPVDDLYVSERIYGACLGAVVRAERAEAVRRVAQATYNHVFSSGRPPAHLLLRDYARQIVEYAVSIGCAFAFDIAQVRPPYQSEPPPEEVATWDELQARYKGHGYGELILSLWPDHGDFARYVMHSDSCGLHTWVSTADPYAEARRLAGERVDLPEPLAAEWHKVSWRCRIEYLDLSAYDPQGSTDEDGGCAGETSGEPLHETAEGEQDDDPDEVSRFLASLSPEERLMIERHEEAEARYREALDRANESMRHQRGGGQRLCCWVMTRVLELGWTPERFAEFDRKVNRNNAREARKPERIGKKYQWIAYHELAARVTDHYPNLHEYFSEGSRYQGPWQRDFRDIDPTLLVKDAPTERVEHCWWLPVPDPLAAAAQLEDQEWLLHGPTVPNFAGLITVSRPGESTRWLTLHNRFEWSERGRRAEGSMRPRRLSFGLGAFIVRRSDLTRIVADVSDGEWTGMEVGCPDLDEQFLGEFPWGQSFEELRRDAVAELTDPIGDQTVQRVTFKPDGPQAARPVVRYTFSSGFDCSHSETIRGFAPSLWLTRRVGLSWGKTRFRFVDASGRVVAFDPSFEEAGPGAFLIEEGALLRFLEAHDLSVLWLLIGEKMLTVRDDGWDDRSSPMVSVFRQVYEATEESAKLVSRSIGLLGAPGMTY